MLICAQALFHYHMVFKIKHHSFSAKNTEYPCLHIIIYWTSAHTLLHICTDAVGLLLGVNSGCLLAAMEGIMMWLWTALPFLMMQTNCDDTNFLQWHCKSVVDNLLGLLQPSSITIQPPPFTSPCLSVRWCCVAPQDNYATLMLRSIHDFHRMNFNLSYLASCSTECI